MDNYQAIAYAILSIESLSKSGREITPESIKGAMLYQMDMNTEEEAEQKADEILMRPQ